jgi:predicted O-methyltransferase YrrM
VQALVRVLKPKVTLEVGLAFGVSALYILDVLANQPESRHIVIDPCQYDSDLWNGCGLRNIEKAGFQELVESYTFASSLA